ncbi:MAG: hypothetical protein PHD51_01040 [Patescibacteria group bacterium]|nr:hypothetical protein [Patescibacteria group bacterium]MDD5490552.1 hypothetical protein [Patescibacteria group bacterium]
MTKETKDYKEKESPSIEKLLKRIRTEDTLMSAFLVRRNHKEDLKRLLKDLPSEEFSKSCGDPSLKTPLLTKIKHYVFGSETALKIAQALNKIDANYKKLETELKKFQKTDRRVYFYVLSTENGEVFRVFDEITDEANKEIRAAKKKKFF